MEPGSPAARKNVIKKSKFKLPTTVNTALAILTETVSFAAKTC